MRCWPVRSAIVIAILIVFFAASAPSIAELKPGLMFSDHMVLQRGKPIRVWGTATRGSEIAVAIGGASAKTKTDKDGKWRVELPAMEADGKSHTLTIKGDGAAAEMDDVKIGEVWFVAGQSNVAAGMGNPGDTAADLRLMSVDHVLVHGWHVATPENVLAMPSRTGEKRWRSVSYVAYHFGRHLQEKLGVPVGVIHADQGGSPIAWWLPSEHEAGWPDTTIGADVPAGANKLPGNLHHFKTKKLGALSLGGIVWWQGESDGRNADYARDLETLVADWRTQLGQPKLPVIAIQIAPNTYAGGPVIVWEAQQWAARHIDGFYIAPNEDAWVGRSNGVDKNTGWPASGGNPHPPAKDRAAQRAADIAPTLTGKVLGREVFGPTFASHEVKGDAIVVAFDHVGDGLKARDDSALTWFEIAGPDGKYVKADAKVVGKDTVEVSAPGVSDPTTARFGWSAVAMPNLVNSAGLPAMSFRTDRPE